MCEKTVFKTYHKNKSFAQNNRQLYQRMQIIMADEAILCILLIVYITYIQQQFYLYTMLYNIVYNIDCIYYININNDDNRCSGGSDDSKFISVIFDSGCNNSSDSANYLLCSEHRLTCMFQLMVILKIRHSKLYILKSHTLQEPVVLFQKGGKISKINTVVLVVVGE